MVHFEDTAIHDGTMVCSSRLEVITGSTLHRVWEFLFSICWVLKLTQTYKGNSSWIRQTSPQKTENRHKPGNGEREFIVEIVNSGLIIVQILRMKRKAYKMLEGVGATKKTDYYKSWIPETTEDFESFSAGELDGDIFFFH